MHSNLREASLDAVAVITTILSSWRENSGHVSVRAIQDLVDMVRGKKGDEVVAMTSALGSVCAALLGLLSDETGVPPEEILREIALQMQEGFKE